MNNIVIIKHVVDVLNIRIKTMTKLEQLKQELEDLKSEHLSMWESSGSGLCVSDMLEKEAKLELQIIELEADEEEYS